MHMYTTSQVTVKQTDYRNSNIIEVSHITLLVLKFIYDLESEQYCTSF